jgi:membrane protease YdiL (CAAX protease family)
MFNPVFNPERRLRNGIWIALFFVFLAALVVPAQLYASEHGFSLPVLWQAGMVAAVIIFCQRLRRQPLSHTFGTWRSIPQGIGMGITAGFGIWMLASLVLWLSGMHWQYNGLDGRMLGSAAMACLATALAEELIFRGFLFQRLIDGLGAWPAQLLMAAYFVLNHWDNPGMQGGVRMMATLNIFLASLLFGFAWMRTRSLALPVALHFMLNFSQGPLLGFGVSGNASQGLLSPELSSLPVLWTGGSFGLEASLPGTVVIALATLLMFRCKGLHKPA